MLAYTNRWLRYFYMSTSKTFAELQWPLLQPSYKDFQQAAERSMKQDLKQGIAPRTGSTAIPSQLGLTMSKILSNYKKAGTLSNHKMSSATAWLTANSANNFVDADKAWTGH